MDRRPTRLNGVGSERSGLQRAESLTPTQDSPTPPDDRGHLASLNRPWKKGTVHRASVVARLIHNRRRRLVTPQCARGKTRSPWSGPTGCATGARHFHCIVFKIQGDVFAIEGNKHRLFDRIDGD